MQIQHPHNNLFEKVMELKEAVIALVHHFLPKNIVQELDLSTLKQEHDSFITEELTPFLSDTIYSCKWKGKKTFLSFLFEHKSKYELPDLQLMSYTISGYKKQALQWQASTKTIKRQKGKQPKSEKYTPNLILPVLFYHGRETWQDKTFADLFDLPNEHFSAYIPAQKYFLINLAQHPDDKLETIEMKILLGMLLLFKHKGDKEYVLKNFRKIFIFVKEDVAGNVVGVYIKLFILYIFQTFKMKKEEITEILPALPKSIKKELMSTYDIAVAEGYEKGNVEGYQKGNVEGYQKGNIVGEIKTKLETLVELMLKFPAWSNELLSEISKISVPAIIVLKQAFKEKNQKRLTLEVRKLFAKIPNLPEKHWLAIDQLTKVLWKRYKQGNKI